MLKIAKEKIEAALIAKTKLASSLITHDPISVSAIKLS